MLVDARTMLADALANHYTLGFFEAWEHYSLEAVAEAADEVGVPVILGFGESVIDTSWFDAAGVEEVAALGLAAARRCRQDVALIFNEVASFAHVVRGMHGGFNMVMLDSSHLGSQEHLALTSQVVAAAHPLGVAVEAEVGELPMASAEGEHGGTLTDPGAAARFVKQTGIDALSVAVGNVHLMTEGEASVDLDLIAAIRREANIPLVLHGGSGLPEAALKTIRKAGVAKINVGTILKQRFLDGMKEAIAEADPSLSIHARMGSREKSDILDRGKQHMKQEVKRRLKLYTA